MNRHPGASECESSSQALAGLRDCLNRTPSTMRILVVEDNTASQSVVTTIIEKLGGQADVAANGCEALKALSATPYDVVLMDCQMPEMDGLETTRRIRRAESGIMNPQVPVVALTAAATEEDRAACLAAGMNDYLLKPFALTELAHALERWHPLSRGTPPLQHSPDPVPPISGTFQGTSATQASAAPWDPAVFDAPGVMKRLLGDAQLARNVVTRFLDDVPAVVDQATLAASQAEFKKTRALAHQIKGAAATVGGATLQRIASQIESATNAEHFDTLIPQLHTAFKTLSEILVNWVTPASEKTKIEETP